MRTLHPDDRERYLAVRDSLASDLARTSRWRLWERSVLKRAISIVDGWLS